MKFERENKMKRIISIILALITCASLASCGGETESEKYDEIIRRLENKDYDGAIYLIEQMRDLPETDEDGEEIEYELDANTMESVYNNVTSVLDDFDPLYIRTTPYDFYDDITGTSKSFETKDEYFAYLEECLEKLGDYKESKDYLSRMYSVDDVLLYTKTVYTDAFGAEQSMGNCVNAYTRDGKLSMKSSSAGLFSYLTNNSYGRHTYFYDEDGNVQKIEFRSSPDSDLSAVIDYAYKDGKVQTVRFQSSGGDSRTIEYEYDAEGRIAKIKGVFSNYGNSDPKDMIFEYNDKGQLVREYFITENNYRVMYTYEYDSDGNLTYKEEAKQNLTPYGGGELKFGAECTGWKYTYDEKGRIATETEIDLGYLNENRESVNYSGDPVEDPKLDFDRVTTYYYGDFFGFEEK